jgi:hypothetical protein
MWSMNKKYKEMYNNIKSGTPKIEICLRVCCVHNRFIHNNNFIKWVGINTHE